MQERETKRRGGRPRQPKIVRNSDGTLSVRATLELEGETVRKMVSLGTSDRAVAKARADRLLAGEAPELFEKKGETFREIAERVMAESQMRTAKERTSRLRRYAYPFLGELCPSNIRVADIRACLGKVEDELGWTNTVRHLKNDISAVLGELYSDGVLEENAALRVTFKKKPIVRVTPLRIVLSDGEFSKFIEYGVTQADRGALPELYMLCLSARCLGGMRTSDLHAWRWEHIDLVQWFDARVPRPKTQGPAVFDEAAGFDDATSFVLEPYELPPDFGRFLYAWWHAAGSPTEGPVFPVRRGPRAGLHKRPRSSYAEDLRDALWAAGVVRPLPSYAQARPEDRRQHCQLQAGIAGKRSCVDFHSFRRAFVTATTRQKGLSFQESMRLADHSDPTTHMKYMRDEHHRVIPGGALPPLPALPAAPGGGFGSGAAKTQEGPLGNHQ